MSQPEDKTAMTTRSDRKSNAEHKAQGTYRKDRHGHWDLPVKRPMMPYKLNPKSKEVWKKVCDVMEAAGTISKVDALALELLCDSIIIYRESHKALLKSGLIVGGSKGGGVPRQNPAATIRDASLKQILNLLKEFGMTPAARGQKPDTNASEEAKQKIFDILNPEGEDESSDRQTA